MKCAYCKKELPENGNSRYMLASGPTSERLPACLHCIKELKLKIVELKGP